jgi:hypothetical protein
MPSIHRFIPLLVPLCALTACATAPSPFARNADDARPVASAVHAHVTGSRIPVPAGDAAGPPASNSVQQVVTQRDIRLTGQTDLAAALRQLVPALN